MKKLLSLCGMLLFALTLQGAGNVVAEVTSFGRPLEIKLDGVPNEAFWQKAGKITKFHKFRHHNVPVTASTEVRVCLDDNNVYLAFICQEPLKIVTGTAESSLWGIDHLDMLFSSIEDKDWFRQIAFALNGKSYEEFVTREDYKKAVHIGKNFWSAELVVSRRALGDFNEKSLRFNVLRKRTEAKETQSWGKVVSWALEPQNLGIFHLKTLPGEVTHGPWSSQVGVTSAVIAWQTNAPGKGVLSFRKGNAGKFVTLNAVNKGKLHMVKLEKLAPATCYQYQVNGSEKTYSFTTLDPKPGEFAFAFTTDIHGESAQLKKVLTNPAVRKADIFFLGGDLLTGVSGHYSCYNGFLDALIENWPKTAYCFRGNHEYRGIPGPFEELTAPLSNKSYGAFLHKGVFFLYLDSADGKFLNTPYMQEQLKFVEKAIKSAEFRNARFSVLLAHNPLTDGRGWQTPELAALYGVIQKYKADGRFDLMLSGHRHAYHRILAGSKKIYSTHPAFNGKETAAALPFPMLVNDRGGMILVDVKKDRLEVTVISSGLKVLDKLTFPAKAK